VIPGDGIGQEVVPEGVRVLNAVAPGRFDYEQFDWSSDYYK
jgi:tartrate dehydrogenase/decarboxylase/D-malate dehydrogenase